MPVSTGILTQHIDYSAWATQHLLRAAAQLSGEELNRDFGTADKSVLGTLVHIFGADRVWLRRVLRQETGGFPTVEERSLPFLEAAWPNVHSEWKQWAGRLSPEALERPVAYRDIKGREHESLPWEIVLHLVNHGTHHRGQVSGFLRAMGKTPAPLDLIAFYRGRAKPPV